MTTSTFEDLRKILRGRKHYEIYDFPGTKDSDALKIGIRVLSQNDVDTAYQIAEQKILFKNKDKKVDLADASLNRELERQILYRSIISIPSEEEIESGEYTKFFPSSETIGELLSIDEVSHLMQLYNSVQEKYSPVYSLKDEKDFENLVETLKKKSVRGLCLNTYELEGLVDFLIANFVTLPKDNGISSSPLNQSNKNESKKL